MGYTHYYSGKANLTAALPGIRKIISTARTQGIGVFGWDGYGTPKITALEISLNGDAENDLDYETFMVNPDGHGFCKTGMMAYDAVVGAILILLTYQNPETFTVESDGDMHGDEWSAPRNLYQLAFDRAVPQEFELPYLAPVPVDLDEYTPGEDVDEDDRVIAELLAYRAGKI